MRVALLKVSVLALAGMTWIFCSFVFATRPEEVEADALSALVRLPASIPSQLPDSLPGVFAPTIKINEPIEMEVVKVPCWDKSDDGDQETSARWIRLTGRPCQLSHGSEDQVSVRNLTNGYSATVFANQASGMTTDFIPLREGKNEILIRFEQTPGAALESQFTFYRE